MGGVLVGTIEMSRRHVVGMLAAAGIGVLGFDAAAAPSARAQATAETMLPETTQQARFCALGRG